MEGSSRRTRVPLCYVSGVEHIERRNIRESHEESIPPRTDMGRGEEVVAAVNRAPIQMPGTVPPFVTRLDHRQRRSRHPRCFPRHAVDKDIQDMDHAQRCGRCRQRAGWPARPRSVGESGAIVVSSIGENSAPGNPPIGDGSSSRRERRGPTGIFAWRPPDAGELERMVGREAATGARPTPVNSARTRSCSADLRPSGRRLATSPRG